MRPEISIIVPFYNSKKTLRECLLSLLNCDFDRQFEIIVVDDGSTDGSAETIRDLDMRLIRKENGGAASARNAGAKEARSNLLLFVDADVVFFKDTLKKVYAHLEKDDVDYLTVRYSKRPMNKKWIHRYKALADYCYYYDFLYTEEQKKKPLKQVPIAGGIEGYKKKVFEELGGFDERIKGASIEEEKLIHKLSRDYRMLADGNIKTAHNFPDFGRLVRDYFLRTFHSMNIVCKDGYRQPYLKDNALRVALGGLTVVSLVLSLCLYAAFGYAIPFIVTLAIFLAYLSSHFSMFVTAFKEYGFIFMLYMLLMNLFFCSVLSFAGFLGTIKSILGR